MLGAKNKLHFNPMFALEAAKASACNIPVMVALINGGASLTARDQQGDTVLNYILR